MSILFRNSAFFRRGKSRKMVRDQYQVMGLVIPPKTYPHRPNVYFHCHVYSSLARSGQWYGNEIILPVTANLNFWSRAISCNLALPEKCTNPERKCMRTRSVCGFFLTWVGSYENHCFGINAHTFLFQVGHPIYGKIRQKNRCSVQGLAHAPPNYRK